VSRMSGVTIRTPHFYHQTGLLKPADVASGTPRAIRAGRRFFGVVSGRAAC